MNIEEIQSMCRALSNLAGNYISVDLSIRAHVTGNDLIDFDFWEVSPGDNRIITRKTLKSSGDLVNYLRSRIDAFLSVTGEGQ